MRRWGGQRLRDVSSGCSARVLYRVRAALVLDAAVRVVVHEPRHGARLAELALRVIVVHLPLAVAIRAVNMHVRQVCCPGCRLLIRLQRFCVTSGGPHVRRPVVRGLSVVHDVIAEGREREPVEREDAAPARPLRVRALMRRLEVSIVIASAESTGCHAEGRHGRNKVILELAVREIGVELAATARVEPGRRLAGRALEAQYGVDIGDAADAELRGRVDEALHRRRQSISAREESRRADLLA